jgi:3-oxoacyl-[acyl-carrier protein] reductase
MKHIFITGGSRGIGAAMVRAFSSAGYRVSFTYLHSQEGAMTLAEETGATPILADCRNPEAISAGVAQAIEENGGVDILVNNAGITRDGLVLRMSEQQWDEVMDSNLKSAFNAIHAVAPLMMKKRAGVIINMTSVVGVKGNIGQVNYSASKAGMIGLTTSVAKEFGARGIRCNAIAPGFIVTEMTDATTDAQRKFWMDMVPMRRCGQPEEVANVALFLASDLASYVSGQVINCCGGLTP